MNRQDTKLILQDSNEHWQALLPLTYTRPISGLRIGIDTIQEKWEANLELSAQIDTEDYLLPKFKQTQQNKTYNLVINSSILPNEALIKAINQLQPQQALEQDGEFIAMLVKSNELPLETIEVSLDYLQITRPWHIFHLNDQVLVQDFKRITKSRSSQPIPEGNQIKQANQIFIETGATVEFSVLDASTGPIYIGKNATIMPGCLIRGGLALCEGAIMKMGTKHYGASTIGPYSKIGGEVNNVILQAYSNKGHDGFLGNSVLGEWCNLGADTNASNLKNNYSEISAFSYLEHKAIPTGLQFMGLIMGDHCKTAISTTLNTATVAGVGSNIFGAGFPKTHIPSFIWGGVDFSRTFILQKAFSVAEAMMNRRGLSLSQEDQDILTYIFEQTKSFRT